jgi:hypothetical protein
MCLYCIVLYTTKPDDILRPYVKTPPEPQTLHFIPPFLHATQASCTSTSFHSAVRDKRIFSFRILVIYGRQWCLVDLVEVRSIFCLFLSQYFQSGSSQLFCCSPVQLCNKHLMWDILNSKPIHVYMRLSGCKTTLVSDPHSVLCGCRATAAYASGRESCTCVGATGGDCVVARCLLCSGVRCTGTANERRW